MDKGDFIETLYEMEKNARKCAADYQTSARANAAFLAEAQTLRLVARMLDDESFCELIRKLFQAANNGIDTGDIESLADANDEELTKAYTYANSL